MYQVNDKGEEERPKPGTRTYIKFSAPGQVVFNKVDRDQSDQVTSRSGKYTVEQNDISITDDAGNTVRWPYQITGDILVIVIPEVKKKFYWRRSK